MTKTKQTAITPRDPADFGLASFLDLLPTRTPLIGQCATSYETFRLGHLRDLQPTTALQCTVCENLIANEWDLMQHRRMRDRVIANKLADLVERAAFEALKQAHEDKLDAELQAWVDAGNEESAWEETPFNHNDARMDATDLAKSFEDAGVAAIIYTDINRDGAMQGPNIEATAALARAVSIPVIASGGVSSLDDLIALRDCGADLNGAISGRALYDGALDLKAALAALKG